MPTESSAIPSPERLSWRSYGISIGTAAAMTVGVILGMWQNDIPFWLMAGLLVGIAVGALWKRGAKS